MLTIDEMPKHRHRVSYWRGSVNDFIGGSNAEYGLSTDGDNITYGYQDNVIGTSGGDLSHNNMPPYISLTYCIKD